MLAQGDLAALILYSRRDVGVDIAAHQSAGEAVFPYRGSVQEVGATPIHRVEVIRLLEARYLDPEICDRLETWHSLAAVESFVQTDKNVLKLLDRGLAPLEIAGILATSRRLVERYIEIVQGTIWTFSPTILCSRIG